MSSSEVPGPSSDSGKGTAMEKKAVEAKKKMMDILPFYVQRSNLFVSRLNKLLATSNGKDRALMTVNYALIVLTTQLDALSTLRSSLNKVTKISVLPADIFPNSPTLLILSRRPRELSKLYALSTRLKILAAMISDVRIFMRLWGLLGIWQWGVDTMRNPPDDKILRQITYLQVISNVFYQVLENGAYLAQHKVLPFDAKKQTQMWLWSSRFWAAHVGLEFWRLARDKQLRSSGEEKAWYDIAEEQKNSLWWKQLYVNLAYAPLTIHWSLENGALSRSTVGVLGVIAGWIGLQRAWQNTA